MSLDELKRVVDKANEELGEDAPTSALIARALELLKPSDTVESLRAQLEAAREEHSGTWQYLQQARQERDTALDVSHAAQAQVAKLTSALKKIEANVSSWGHSDETCSRAEDCDERDGDGCSYCGPDACPECECGKGVLEGILRAALATVPASHSAPAVVPTGPEVQQGAAGLYPARCKHGYPSQDGGCIAEESGYMGPYCPHFWEDYSRTLSKDDEEWARKEMANVVDNALAPVPAVETRCTEVNSQGLRCCCAPGHTSEHRAAINGGWSCWGFAPVPAGPEVQRGEGEGRRAPVQRDMANAKLWGELTLQPHGPGTISWAEHMEAWGRYGDKYGRDQSAERIAERGGFSYFELVELLRRPPNTWKALVEKPVGGES